MNLLIMGAAGSGKGTASARIKEHFEIPHISTGDMFRKHISEQTVLGQKAKSYIDHGDLVPDSITIEMVRERLNEPDCKDGYLLDGFPRTLEQAYALEKLTREIGRPLECVINLMADDEVLIERVTGRRICPKDGSVYHIHNRPPKVADHCDLCGSELVHRTDDTEERLKVRLDVFRKETVPCIEYYREIGLVRDYDGEKDADAVLLDIYQDLEIL